MQKKTTGVVAGIAGAALLMGGTTFALWSDSADVDGAQISSGNLDVEVSEWAWKDVSDDRKDKDHEIDLNEFKIIPGDTVAGTFGIDLSLEGDNMAARIQLTDEAGDPITSADDLVSGDLAAGLVDVAFEVALGGTTVPLDFDDVTEGITLYSHDNTNPGAFQLRDVTESVTVTVTATFDENTEDQVLTEAQATLAASSFQLAQVRTDAAGYIG